MSSSGVGLNVSSDVTTSAKSSERMASTIPRVVSRQAPDIMVLNPADNGRISCDHSDLAIMSAMAHAVLVLE